MNKNDFYWLIGILVITGMFSLSWKIVLFVGIVFIAFCYFGKGNKEKFSIYQLYDVANVYVKTLYIDEFCIKQNEHFELECLSFIANGYRWILYPCDLERKLDELPPGKTVILRKEVCNGKEKVQVISDESVFDIKSYHLVDNKKRGSK